MSDTEPNWSPQEVMEQLNSAPLANCVAELGHALTELAEYLAPGAEFDHVLKDKVGMVMAGYAVVVCKLALTESPATENQVREFVKDIYERSD